MDKPQPIETAPRNYFCAPAAEWLPKIWLSREVVTCSLLGVGYQISPRTCHIRKVEHSIVASAPVVGRKMVGECFNASPVFFPNVYGRPVWAILMHWGNVPLLVLQKATGLPITPTGIDLRIDWQRDPPYVARLPHA